MLKFLIKIYDTCYITNNIILFALLNAFVIILVVVVVIVAVIFGVKTKMWASNGWGRKIINFSFFKEM